MATSAKAPIDLATINRMDRADFTDAFGDIYEHSPWIAEQAFDAHPFDSLDAVRDAMVSVVRTAPVDRQLALLNAHPELAGREAKERSLTQASTEEQASAGLVDLAPEEMARVAQFNGDYRAKFGFPFIIAVRNHTKTTILAAMEQRLANDREAEMIAALDQIFEITRMRLDTLFRDTSVQETAPGGGRE